METKSVRRRGAVHVTYVESDSEYGKQYQIAQLPDGALACACIAYVFNRAVPKTCKHIIAYRAAAGAATYRQRQRVKERARIPVERVETFTFRRAITFGAIPTGRDG